MARKKIEANYTQLENETLEALARAQLTAREFRVMLAVLRLTNGYHLTENKVGITYLIQLTGIPRQHLWETVNHLAAKQLISRDRRGMIACHGPTLWKLVTPISDKDHSKDVTPMGDEKSTVTSPKRLQKTSPPWGIPKENVKKTTSGGVRFSRTTNPVFNGIFQEMRGYLGYPEKTPQDPIPSYGKEAQAIKRMLTRGFTREDILACWKGKVSQRGGEFVSMVWVNEDIGQRKDSYGKDRGLRERGGHPQPGQPPVRSVTAEDLESGRVRFDGRRVVWADEEGDKAGGDGLPDMQ